MFLKFCLICLFCFRFRSSRYRSNRSGGILGQQQQSASASVSSTASSNNSASSSSGVSITWTRSCQVISYFFKNWHLYVLKHVFFFFKATCSKQPCLSCAGNPLLTPSSQSGGPAAAAAAVAAAASAAETEHRIYLRSHRQRRNQQLLQIQQQQQQVANLTLRPWTRSRAQQVLHHYQLEQLHPSHTGISYQFIDMFTLPEKTPSYITHTIFFLPEILIRCRLFD